MIETLALQFAWVTVAIDVTGTAVGFRYYVPQFRLEPVLAWPWEVDLTRSTRLNNLGPDFNIMEIAYVFSSSGQTVDYILGDMILPQLEHDHHGVDVVGMFFFHDNTYALRAGDPLGERLTAVADEQEILLMLCVNARPGAASPKKLGNPRVDSHCMNPTKPSME